MKTKKQQGIVNQPEINKQYTVSFRRSQNSQVLTPAVRFSESDKKIISDILKYIVVEFEFSVAKEDPVSSEDIAKAFSEFETVFGKVHKDEEEVRLTAAMWLEYIPRKYSDDEFARALTIIWMEARVFPSLEYVLSVYHKLPLYDAEIISGNK